MSNRGFRSVLVLSVLAAPLAAQSWLRGPFHVSPGGAIEVTLAGDVSGDGLQDLVFLFDGQLPQLALAAPGEPPGVSAPIAAAPWIPARGALGDLDGDGLQDLVLLHPDQTRLVVLRAVGGGNFSNDLAQILPNQATGLALLDVDSDGRLDIILAQRGQPHALVLHNQGGLQFSAGPAIPALAGATQLLFADVTADGVPDLLSADGPLAGAVNDLVLAPGLGGGAFLPALGYPVGDVFRIAAGDLDGDGAADVAHASEVDHQVLVRHGGPAGLGAPTAIATAQDVGGLVVVDLDRDGLADLALALRDHLPVQVTGLVEVRLQQGDGSLSDAVLWGAQSEATELTATDLDHDGGADLLVNSGSLTIARGQGDGRPRNTFGFEHPPDLLVIGDGDDDGHVDLLVAEDFGSTAVQLLSSQPVGAFALPRQIEMGFEPRTFALGDLTGDGLPDVLAFGNLPTVSVLAVSAGLGGGSFAPPVTSPSTPYADDVVLVDAEGDGDLDAYVTASNLYPENGLSVLLNDGAGVLTKLHGLKTPKSALDLDVADVNQDGRQDLGITGYEDVFFQYVAQPDGKLVQSDSENFDQANIGLHRSAGYDDFDGDGVLDVLIGIPMTSGSRVRVLHGAGDGSFTLLGEQPLPAVPGLLELVDLDGDQRLDLLIDDSYDDQLVVFPRLPGGAPGAWFAAPVVELLPCPSDAMATGDFDGDGATDVATLHEDAHLVAVWNNQLGPWKDLGHSLAGPQGWSRLAGAGTLSAGSAMTLLVEHAPPLAPLVLVAGGSQIDAPFKGGVLVPQPQLLLGGLLTDSDGVLALPATWPAGLPSGLSFCLQAWVDLPGPAWAATNGISATTP